MKLNFFSVFCLLLLIFSCKTKEKASTLNYMQNIEQIAIDASKKNNATPATIQIGDQLVILVTAKDMTVVRPFNQNYFSSDLVQPSAAGGNTPSAGQTTFSGPTYIVDSEGNIDFPTLGKVSTTGKTIVELKDDLRNKISKYVIDPSVNVRLSNFKVTILGEVSKPGDYTVPAAQGTILNALGLAGDLSMYGNRNDVLVIRNIDGNITQGKIDLKDADFINSPYYNLRQGDVIYVSANAARERSSKMNPNTGIYISIASVALGLLGLFVTIFKK